MKIIFTHKFYNHAIGNTIRFSNEYKTVKEFTKVIYHMFDKNSQAYRMGKMLSEGYGDIIIDMKIVKDELEKIVVKNEVFTCSYNVEIVES